MLFQVPWTALISHTSDAEMYYELLRDSTRIRGHRVTDRRSQEIDPRKSIRRTNTFDPLISSSKK